MEIQGLIRFETPAKINPHLRVLAALEGGYHEVDLSLAPISLFDRIELLPAPLPGLTLRVEGDDSLGGTEENLAYRAAVAFQEATGSELSLEIRLIKNIPAGAGLGGGSGNAAGMLVALNALSGDPLDGDRLAELALALGSDVPFFLAPRPARARGRGEKLEPWPNFPPLQLLVVKPQLSISTREAYRLVEADPHRRSFPPPNTLEEVLVGMENDFENKLLPLHPELEQVKERLKALGAAGAMLSGSGSALFGVFRESEERDEAARELGKNSPWEIFPCRVVEKHEYRLERPGGR